MRAVRCGHSSDSGWSALHEGGQAPAELRGRRRVHREPGRMKPFGKRPHGGPPTRLGDLCASVPVNCPPRTYTSQPVSISRTSSRSNVAGVVTVSAGGTHRSPQGVRHNRRPQGLLLRPSTSGVSGKRPWRFGCRALQLFGRPVPRGLPGTSTRRRFRRETTSGRQRPCRSETYLSGQTPRSSTGGRARSNNEGQPSAAPSNPGCSGLATLAAEPTVRLSPLRRPLFV